MHNRKLPRTLESDNVEQSPYKLSYYDAAIGLFLILALVTCYLQSEFREQSKGADYHKEILQSDSISYIKNGNLIALKNGAYPVAVPSQDSFVNINGKDIFPMLLIFVPEGDSKFNLYPLNIADDSILPRRGNTLVLHILFGFTSDHAENILLYEEKVNNSAADDYKRKAFYYLEVKDGYGKMKRGYMTSENAGEALKWYRDVNHVKEELTTIYNLVN